MSSNIGDRQPRDAATLQVPGRGRGRPKGFDATGALEAAMRVFWAQGYAAAPVDLLCRQMHMPRASMYQTYGDKERLFLAAVAHYVDTRIARIAAHLEAGQDLAQDLTGFFNSVIALATDDPATPGCLVACVLADAAGANPRLQAELSLRFEAIERRLTDRLHLAQSRGELAPGADLAALAGMLAALARGLMVRARAGCGPGALRPMAATAVGFLGKRQLT